MATLQDIITNNTTLTRSQLRSDKGLVTEIQIKLRTALWITVRDSRILSLPYLPFPSCPRWMSKTL